MPKIGCGLDKLDWNVVITIIKNVLIDWLQTIRILDGVTIKHVDYEATKKDQRYIHMFEQHLSIIRFL